MKTNTKKVINILLTLSMLVSMVTVFGSVALAAPVPKDGMTAVCVVDEVTVSFEADDDEGHASVMVYTKTITDGVESPDYTRLVHIDQTLPAGVVEGENSFSFVLDITPYGPLFSAGGMIVKIIVRTADFERVAYVAVAVDKTALIDLFNAGPRWPDKDKYYGPTWDIYIGALDWAAIVIADPLASQIVVDAAYDRLEAAIAQLRFLLTAVQVDALALQTVVRNQTYFFDVIPTAPGLFEMNIEWTINPLYGYTDNEKGSVTILNRTGTVVLYAEDTYSGIITQITLRII